MRRIDWKIFVLFGIIISVAVGFLYGTGILGGAANDPGSKEDPLATKSYAEQAMERRMQEMDDKILSLEAKIRSLEDEMSILSGDGIIEPPSPATGTGAPASSAAPGSTTGSGSGSGSSSSAVSSANIGKTASVTADVVNLREAASTSSNIKKRLSPSDTFTITKVDKEWYQVQLSDGTVGWVAGYLVKIK